MRILLDVDGVLGDFPSECLRFCNQYGRAFGSLPFTLEMVDQHDILKALKLEHLQERFDQHCIDTDFCRHMPLYEGARDFAEKLRSLGEVVVVTSPYAAVPTWCHARLAWLKQHFGIDKQNVIFAKRKELVRGDVLIDDKLSNCEAFADTEWNTTAIVLDRPWNRGPSNLLHPNQLLRAASYEQALQLVRAL